MPRTIRIILPIICIFLLSDIEADGKSPYKLPFPYGKAYRVLQGNKGKTSHTASLEYAFDFQMDEGTKVAAARGGVVVGVKEDSDRGGPDRSFIKDGNYVWIRHEDGTVGHYFHFRKNGVLVKPGDRVLQGDIIAFSGNTGWSGTPHLHFHVSKSISISRSIPISFSDVSSNNGIPITGQICTSQNYPTRHEKTLKIIFDMYDRAELYFEFGYYKPVVAFYKRILNQKLRIELKPLEIAKQRLEKIEKIGKDTLDAAKKESQKGEYKAALNILYFAREDFGNLNIGKEIKKKFSELKKDARYKEAIKDLKEAKAIRKKLMKAIDYENKKKRKAAIKTYEDILKNYPDNRYADKIKKRLEVTKK